MHGPIFFCWFGGIKVIFWQNARNQVVAFALLHLARTQKNERNSSETKLSSNILYFSFSCLEFCLNFVHCIFLWDSRPQNFFALFSVENFSGCFFGQIFNYFRINICSAKSNFYSRSSRPWSVGGSREWHCAKWSPTIAFALVPFFLKSTNGAIFLQKKKVQMERDFSNQYE